MKIRQYDLVTLVWRSFLGNVKSRVVAKEKLFFPNNIGEYKFLKLFKKVGPRKSYQLGLYKNNRGGKAIAKMINADIKGYHYFSLCNEIAVYKVINSALKRVRKNMPIKFKDIYVPNLIDVYEDRKRLVSMVEFVEGKVIESYKPYAKIHVYFKIVDFLKYIGKNLTDTEKKRISKRTPLQYILLYPLLVFNSFFVNPDAMPYVIAGVPKFVSLVPIMLKNSELELVHRDLHFMNIIRHKKGYALVDFQQCVYTEPLHELITTLRYWWKLKMGDTFDKLLLKELVNKNKDRENFLQLFQVYGINSVTHGLTGEFSKKIINGWIDFLKFCLNPNFYEYTKT